MEAPLTEATIFEALEDTRLGGVLQRERGSPDKFGVPWTYGRDALGAKSWRETSMDVGWTFHSAGGFSQLDRNACPRGQGMLYCELPPWTLVFRL